ncbi:MAG: PEGA domain-containing protein [Acidobacteria bacterium]|nr:PEGA domain-containing protein [Acidobacteriota bacterium]
MTRSKTILLTSLVLCLTLLTVSAVAAQGTLRTRVDPRVAGVFINGKYYGTAAMFSHHQAAIKLEEGNYKVKLVDPMHEDLMIDVGVTAGQETTIRQQMKSLDLPPRKNLGELETENWGNAALYLNGKYYANSAELDNPAYSLLIDAGTYDLKLVPVDGSAGREGKITINAKETLVLSKGKADAQRK